MDIKSLKIPEGIIGGRNRRRTDNTMSKRKRSNNNVKRTPLNTGRNQVKGKQFLLHMWHPSYYFCCKPSDKTNNDLQNTTHLINVLFCTNGYTNIVFHHLMSRLENQEEI